MRSHLIRSLLFSLLMAIPAWAQNPSPDAEHTPDTITAAQDAVVIQNLPSGRGTAAIGVSGYCSCTLVIEGRTTAAGDWEAVEGAPTIDADGIYFVTASGLQALRVRASAWGSGTTTIAMRVSSAGGGSGGGGGGAGSSDTTEATQLLVLAAVDGVEAELQTQTTHLSNLVTNTNTLAAAVNSSRMDVNIAKINGADPTADLTFDMDTAGGTQTRAAIGLAVGASGGAVQVGGAATGLYTHMRTLATGGASSLKYTSAGSTEDKHAICTAACTLYSLIVTNTNAAARYIRCENDTAGNTAPGSETVELDLAIPGNTAGAGFAVPIPAQGVAFSTALTCWLVTGAADTDVAEVAANEIKVWYAFAQ